MAFPGTTWRSPAPPVYPRSGRGSGDDQGVLPPADYIPGPDLEALAQATSNGETIEIIVRDLMNAVENFTINRHTSVTDFAALYSRRTGHKSESLRFKFCQGGLGPYGYTMEGHETTSLSEVRRVPVWSVG